MIDKKYQRHLDIEQRLEYYNQFINKEGVGFILGEHLGWKLEELIPYVLRDCGLSDEEIEKSLKKTL